MSIFSQLPNDLIMRIIRETKSSINFKEDHEDKFKRCLHDVMYVNYYYGVDEDLSCRDNFNDKPTDVLNYNDMINHLREGVDLIDDDDFNLEEHKDNYDKDGLDGYNSHRDFMYQLNNDY